MQQNSLSVQGDYGDFRMVLLIQSCLRIRPEYFAVQYMENTPIDILLSLLRRILAQNKKNQILNHLPRYDRMGKNFK
jgi:hypothetical protein